MVRRLIAIAVLVAVALTWQPARGQCEQQWFPSGAHLAGITGTVYTTTSWDPDGAGPEDPYLVAAGGFTVAEGTPAGSIVGIRGNTHLDFGAGLATGNVFALATYNNELYAGGGFLINGQTLGHIARWDGTQWQPVGGDVNALVSALTPYGGKLIAAGSFSAAGGEPANAIAQWDGTTWSPLGGGVDVDAVSLCVYNGELIAGGTFQTAGGLPANNIAAWNGTSWHALGEGLTGGVGTGVKSLAVHEGSLYAGGSFSNAGGQPSSNIARWDGQAWAPVAGLGFVITTLASSQGALHAAGTGSNSVRRLEAGGWTMLGFLTAEVRSLLDYQGQLIAAGVLTATGSSGPKGIGKWAESGWCMFGSGIDGTINALAYYNGEIIAGGAFTQIGGRPFIGLAATPDGVNWHAVSGDVLVTQGQTTTAGTIAGLLTRPDGLYAIGYFTSIGGVPLNGVGRWNGSTWDPLIQGLMGGTAQSIVEYNGELAMAGGIFTNYGVYVAHVVRWTGTSWGSFEPLFPLGGHYVQCLGRFGGLLLASSDDFTSSPAGSNILQWNGTQWSDFPMVPTRCPNAFAEFNGQLWSGQSSTILTRLVTRFDGTTWLDTPALPNSTTFVKGVFALQVHRGELYAGGSFREVNPGGLAGIARWDGAAWQPLASGGSATVRALLSVNGDLWVGGSFVTVGGQPSAALARWGCNCYANCDNSAAAPILNVNDFQCFLNRFAAADSYANCDGSTNPPVLNVNDFQCFVNTFAAGCQ